MRHKCETLEKTVARIVKRCIDLSLALLGLVFLAPWLVVIALLVRLSSSGPIFYRGMRTGLHGAPFHILKFRTMVENAETLGGTTTGDRDPRITRVGRVLRTYKLDELPQLINVLKGDMSLVGPRPEVAEYTDAYTEEERQILTVRPGITDWASIEFNDLQAVVGSDRPDDEFREKVLPRKNALRLRYVREQSLLQDWRILTKTLLIVLMKPLRG